ncbi:hypothetical protein BDR06DRAFT_1006851 [Suillus hirtellus]|nr:hypothetical protein BDR06DRAFT_1006851 [Suillus hirtellus]
MNQTLTDGASPSGVYAAVSMLALLNVLPLAPFSMNMDRWLNGIILIIFIPRDPHNCVAFVSFAHRPRVADGAFYDYTSPYGAVRQEDRITLRESMFGEYDFPNVQPKGGKVKTPVEIAQDEVFPPCWIYLLIASSNGQTRRARIVKVVLSELELLVPDGSSTGLDVNTRPMLLLCVLRSLPEKRKITNHISMSLPLFLVILGKPTVNTEGGTSDQDEAEYTKCKYLMLDSKVPSSSGTFQCFGISEGPCGACEED